jgi:hypothetical protein
MLDSLKPIMSAGFLEPVARLAGLVLMAECFLGREEVPVRFWCSALITDTHSSKNTQQAIK